MTQNTKKQKTQIFIFFDVCKAQEMEIFAVCGITVEPIRIMPHKMTVWTSVLWKMNLHNTKKWPEMDV